MDKHHEENNSQVRRHHMLAQGVLEVRSHGLVALVVERQGADVARLGHMPPGMRGTILAVLAPDEGHEATLTEEAGSSAAPWETTPHR